MIMIIMMMFVDLEAEADPPDWRHSIPEEELNRLSPKELKRQARQAFKGDTPMSLEKALKICSTKNKIIFQALGSQLIPSESSICGPLGLILCTVFQTLSADSRDEPTLTFRTVYARGYKEMSSILADQQRPRKRAHMRGEGGSCGVSASEYSCTQEPKKLWRSNSIFNLCVQATFWVASVTKLCMCRVYLQLIKTSHPLEQEAPALYLSFNPLRFSQVFAQFDHILPFRT